MSALEKINQFLTTLTTTQWQQETLQLFFTDLIKNCGFNNGDVYWPLRVALSGKEHSEAPLELLLELGQQESITRIKSAIKLLHEYENK